MPAILDRLAAHVSKPHFPLVIFLLAVANTFAVFLSGALTALFVSTCAAWGKPRFAIVAACNAAGAAVGFALFALIVEAHGVDWAREKYPAVFASEHWGRAEEVSRSFGWGGRAFLSAMPFPLHPLVLVSIATGASTSSIVTALFAGRLAKYLAFGWVASSGASVARRASGGAGGPADGTAKGTATRNKPKAS